LVGLNKQDPSALLCKHPPTFSSKEPQSKSGNYWNQKWPKFAKENRGAQLDSLHRFLTESDDNTFARLVPDVFDLDNVIDWHLLLLLSNNGDGIIKNYYLYKQAQSSPYRIAIWDYDHSYGRDGDGEINMLERMLDCKRSVLLKRLMVTDAQDYNNRLATRWNKLRQDLFTQEKISQMMEANKSKISLGLQAENERWPVDDDRWHQDANSFEMELDSMRKYFALRLEQVDRRFGE